MQVSSDGNLPVVCRSCNRTISLNQVKFDSQRLAYVCHSCFASTRPMNKKFVSNVDVSSSQTSKIAKDFVRYSCLKCNYHFQRKKGSVVGECPYCGFEELDSSDFKL